MKRPIFLLLSLMASVNSADDPARLFSKITRRVFRYDKDVCFVWRQTDFVGVLGQALIQSGMVVVTVGVQDLDTFNSFCNGYIVVVEAGDDFVDILEGFQFKSGSRILLMYEIEVSDVENLAMTVNMLGLDVITVKYSANNVTVRSLYKNETLVTKNETNLTSNWRGFKRYKAYKPKLPPDFTVKITVSDCPPYVFVNDNGSSIFGLEIGVLNEILKGYQVEYLLSGDTKDPWLFVFNSVIDKQSDFGACSPWLITSGQRDLDYTYPLTQVCTTFLVEKPSLLPTTFFVFYPLPHVVYVGLITTVSICSLVDNGMKRLFPHWKKTIHSSNLLKLILLFFNLLLSTYYSAGLTSALQNPPIGGFVKDLQDMVDQEVPWRILQGTVNELFMNIQSTLTKRIMKQFVKSSSSRTAIFAKILERVYLCDIEGLPNYAMKHYRALKDCLTTEYTVLILQKNSAFTARASDVVMRLTESGIISQDLKRIIDLDRNVHEAFFSNYGPQEKSAVYIRMEEMVGAFVLLGIGLTLSLVLFIGEIWYWKRRENELRNVCRLYR